MNTDDELWSATADPDRRHILDLLSCAGEATASRLSHQVPCTRQALTKHPAVLECTGLITRRRDGRQVIFRVDPNRLTDATRALADAWGRRLNKLKQIAEEPAQRTLMHRCVQHPRTERVARPHPGSGAAYAHQAEAGPRSRARKIEIAYPTHLRSQGIAQPLASWGLN